jgi:hypothetical protein
VSCGDQTKPDSERNPVCFLGSIENVVAQRGKPQPKITITTEAGSNRNVRSPARSLIPPATSTRIRDAAMPRLYVQDRLRLYNLRGPRQCRRRDVALPRLSACLAKEAVLEARKKSRQEKFSRIVVQSPRLREMQRLPASAHLPIPETTDHVVVHHAHRLHEGITDRWSHKVKAAALQIFAHRPRFLALRRNLLPGSP